ncbi:MAG TPA: PIN domain-containing protein [Thermoprotei archaeon]|nr:MAG: nucleotide-binding protein [Thermoplasmata archaeon]HDJ50667.1 PIN domain-containing protein [Thermoprotei archaeon]
MIVIDSSAFSKFLIREEGWEKVVPYLDPSVEPRAVDILIVEVSNVIWKYMEKYKLIKEEQALKLYEQMMRLIKEEIIVIEPSVKYLRDALKIAMGYSITVYDTLFLAQAKALNAKLVTSDRRQKEIAEDIGIPVEYVP